jgi:S-formylglutathione hydrolase
VVRGLLFLHGSDHRTLADNAVWTEALERRGVRCLCPRGPDCWWTDAIAPDWDPRRSPLAYLVETVVPWLRDQDEPEPPEIALCGVEVGGQGVLQLAYRWPRLFPRVAALSPKVDLQTWYGHGTTLDQLFSSAEAVRQATAILQLQGLNWPARQLLLCDPDDPYGYDGTATLVSKLASSGIPHTADLETRAGGYGWDYANAMCDRVLAFLLDDVELPVLR